MGDAKAEHPYAKVREAAEPTRAVRSLSDAQIAEALRSGRGDPLVDVALAREAADRLDDARRLSESVQDAILVLDRALNVRANNPAAQRILGTDLRRGATAHDLLHPRGRNCDGSPCHLEEAIERADGIPETAWVGEPARRVLVLVLATEATPTRIVTLRDLTEVGASGVLQARIDVLEGAMRRSLGEIDRRKLAEHDLRESERRLAEIVSTITEGIVILDTQGRFRFYNRSIEELVGRPSARAHGKHYTQLDPWPAVEASGQAQAVHDLIRRTTSGERGTLETTLELDGTPRTFVVTGIPLLDARGEPTGALLSTTDITARKAAEAELLALNRELERRVAERTAQLERANTELEAFTHAATHDLKSPLRGIAALTRALAEDNAAGLDAEGQELVDRLGREARRAARLVDDLLTLSRVARGEMRRETLDLTRLAQEAAERLRAWEPDRRVDIKIAPGLTASGDPTLLATVLDNLLGNAWKYTARTSNAHIEMGSGPDATDPTFYVRDNGIGFDDAQSHLLFQPFRRLRSSAGFEGTGVGLATVARIVERHGGRVWAQGRPGEGATFWFTLPP